MKNKVDARWAYYSLGVVAVSVLVGRTLLGRRYALQDGHTELAAALLQNSSGGWVADSSPLDLVRRLDPRDGKWCDFAVENSSSLSITKFESRYRRPGRPLLVRGALIASVRKEWSKESLVGALANVSTQYGAGSDVIYAGGGSTNHATMAALVERVERAAASPDDVFAFDTKALQAAGFHVPTPAFARRAFSSDGYANGYQWPILSVGPSRGGLPIHAHGETWLGVAHGAKRWLVAAPGSGFDPEFVRLLHPLASSRVIFNAFDDAPQAGMLSCLQRAGDVVYLPAGWKHATLNVGETLAIGEQRAYAARERYEKSIMALDASPRDVEALHGAGVAAAHAGFETQNSAYLHEAAGFLRRAVIERPLQPEVTIVLGEVLAALGDISAAVRVIDDCRRAYSDHTQPRLVGHPNDIALAAVHLKFARFFLGVGLWSHALEPLEIALHLRPDYAMALKDRAVAFENLHRLDLALRDLLRAHSLDPADPDVIENLNRLRQVDTADESNLLPPHRAPNTPESRSKTKSPRKKSRRSGKSL